MPVRCTIHSSDVSTIRSRSAFDNTRGGTYVANPAIFTGLNALTTSDPFPES
jgi:hypothetical protein